MKTLLLLTLAVLVYTLPYADRMTLANSLIVGNNNDLELWTCKVCDETNHPIHSHFVYNNIVEIKAILSVYDEFIILAFRYTANVKNVWQDLLYPFQVRDDNTCDKCKVQKEYNSMWNTIRDNVTADLREIQEQTKLNKLYITGISLGGGLANIAFIDINHLKIFGDVRVTTYGAPKVGNKHWAKFFDDATHGQSRRFIVKGDPIVLLPTCLTPLCNYRQTGIKIVCYENQALCVQEHETDDLLTTVRDWPQVDSDIKDMNSIMDHVNGYPKIYNFTLQLKI